VLLARPNGKQIYSGIEKTQATKRGSEETNRTAMELAYMKIQRITGERPEASLMPDIIRTGRWYVIAMCMAA
jgi:hypothetical protein